MAYTGPERRGRDDVNKDLAEIKTDVKWIVQSLQSFATSERVDAVESVVTKHIDNHISKGGLLASWAGVAVALLLGVFGLMGGL